MWTLRWLLVLVARVIAEMVIAFISLTALGLLYVSSDNPSDAGTYSSLKSVVAHHRSGTHGRIMNQTQEEVLLVFLYGLFWFGMHSFAKPT